MNNITEMPYGIKRAERLLAIAQAKNKAVVYRRIRHQPNTRPGPHNDGPAAA